MLPQEEMGGKSICQQNKRLHQQSKNTGILDEKKINDTRNMAKDRLGVGRMGNE